MIKAVRFKPQGKVLSLKAFRRIVLRPYDGVAWGLFFYLPGIITTRLTLFFQSEPEGRLYILVPSNAAIRAMGSSSFITIDPLFDKIAWWKRIGLASGLRRVSGIIPLRSFDIEAWRTKGSSPAQWLGQIDEDPSVEDPIRFGGHGKSAILP